MQVFSDILVIYFWLMKASVALLCVCATWLLPFGVLSMVFELTQSPAVPNAGDPRQETRDFIKACLFTALTALALLGASAILGCGPAQPGGNGTTTGGGGTTGGSTTGGLTPTNVPAGVYHVAGTRLSYTDNCRFPGWTCPTAMTADWVVAEHGEIRALVTEQVAIKLSLQPETSFYGTANLPTVQDPNGCRGATSHSVTGGWNSPTQLTGAFTETLDLFPCEGWYGQIATCSCMHTFTAQRY